MLELNYVLMATFRFAAGQKSISADDLVVFAEIIYYLPETNYLCLGARNIISVAGAGLWTMEWRVPEMFSSHGDNSGQGTTMRS